VRAVLRTAGLMASAHLDLSRADLEALLGQLERQYRDFSRGVDWEPEAGGLHLAWRLDAFGHASGRLRLGSVPSGWTVEAPLKGDQSYLPQAALGLRIQLRPGPAPDPAGGGPGG
jgi:hypothetical protein